MKVMIKKEIYSFAQIKGIGWHDMKGIAFMEPMLGVIAMLMFCVLIQAKNTIKTV